MYMHVSGGFDGVVWGLGAFHYTLEGKSGLYESRLCRSPACYFQRELNFQSPPQQWACAGFSSICDSVNYSSIWAPSLPCSSQRSWWGKGRVIQSSNSLPLLSQGGGIKKTHQWSGNKQFQCMKLINPLLRKAVRIIYKIILLNSVSAPSTEENKWAVIWLSIGDVGSLCLAFSLCWGSHFLKDDFDPSRKERSLYCISMKLQVGETPAPKDLGQTQSGLLPSTSTPCPLEQL